MNFTVNDISLQSVWRLSATSLCKESFADSFKTIWYNKYFIIIIIFLQVGQILLRSIDNPCQHTSTTFTFIWDITLSVKVEINEHQATPCTSQCFISFMLWKSTCKTSVPNSLASIVRYRKNTFFSENFFFIVEGQCSHHCAIPAPQTQLILCENLIKSFEQGKYS